MTYSTIVLPRHRAAASPGSKDRLHKSHSVSKSKPAINKQASLVSQFGKLSVKDIIASASVSSAAVPTIVGAPVHKASPRLTFLLETQSGAKYLPKPDYLKRVQNDQIKEFMRRDIASWLLKLNKHMEYHPETFGMAMTLMDKLLSSSRVKSSHLQLIAATCFLLASKAGEVWNQHPSFKELCISGNHAFTCAEIERMEKLLLKTLDWNVNPITSYLLVSQIMENVDVSAISTEDAEAVKKNIVAHAETTLESASCEYYFLKYRPATLAISSILLSMKKLYGTGVSSSYVNVIVNLCETENYNAKGHVASCFNDLEGLTVTASKLYNIKMLCFNTIRILFVIRKTAPNLQLEERVQIDSRN
eukprot:Awhi_evm2s3654